MHVMSPACVRACVRVRGVRGSCVRMESFLCVLSCSLCYYAGKYYVVQEGIKLRSGGGATGDDTKKFLLSLMDQLEGQKQALRQSQQQPSVDDEESVKQHITNFALRIFSMADDEDRAGKATKYCVCGVWCVVCMWCACVSQICVAKGETGSLC